MSLGFIGYGRFKEEIEDCLIYEYSGENWNVPHNNGDAFLFDGLISIDRVALKEENWKKAYTEGKIKILKECKNTFYRSDLKFDYLAIQISRHIFNDYKEKCEVPEKVAFIK
jgi:hypothetical protein